MGRRRGRSIKTLVVRQRLFVGKARPAASSPAKPDQPEKVSGSLPVLAVCRSTPLTGAFQLSRRSHSYPHERRPQVSAPSQRRNHQMRRPQMRQTEPACPNPRDHFVTVGARMAKVLEGITVVEIAAHPGSAYGAMLLGAALSRTVARPCGWEAFGLLLAARTIKTTSGRCP